MTKLLYCVEHGRMTYTECGPICGHIIFVPVSYIQGTISYEVDFCEFEQGWATVPPPEFDLDEYIERVSEPPAEIVAEILV